MLSRRAPLEADDSVRPNISSAEPSIPPNSTIAASQGRSPARSGASDRPRPSRTTDRYSQGEARSRAEIEQPGKQQWVGDAEEELGHRCASAEQKSRAEREHRAAMKAVVMQPAALYEWEPRIRFQR